jgi:hypothetical protein
MASSGKFGPWMKANAPIPFLSLHPGRGAVNQGAKRNKFLSTEEKVAYGTGCGTLRGLIPLGPTSCISKRKWPLIRYGYGKGSPTESTFLRFT